MNRWHGCLWVDSVPTRDGRVIAGDAIPSKSVGTSVPVLRDGERIGGLGVGVFFQCTNGERRGAGTTDLAPGWYRIEADFADCDYAYENSLPPYATEVEIMDWDFGLMVMTAGRLATVTVGHRPCWPEAAIVVERG